MGTHIIDHGRATYSDEPCSHEHDKCWAIPLDAATDKAVPLLCVLMYLFKILTPAARSFRDGVGFIEKGAYKCSFHLPAVPLPGSVT